MEFVTARHLEERGLYAPFDHSLRLLSYEMGVEKPDPRAYQILVDTLHLPPSDIVFIDDKWENINAAKEMGIDAILFESPEQIYRELEQRGLEGI